MSKQTILIGCLAFLTASHSFAAPFSYTWRIEDLARTSAETVELRDNKNRLLKRINVKQIIYLYSVIQAIEEVSELRSQLIITDGKQPNAFATKGMAELILAGTDGENADGGKRHGQGK